MYQEKTICELVREMEKNDENGQTTSSKYVKSSMREDINKTEAYLNSKHISGEVDHLGREKPFFNIVLGARNIWFRATDIDRKNIVIRAKKLKEEITAFIASIKLQEWMKKVNFGQFLNDWGLALATHGSAVVKFVEKKGELNCQVVDWNNLLCDAVDFEGNIKIEKLWFTPAQLKKNKSYNQEFVEQLCEGLTTRKTADGKSKDNKANYIAVYEVHGELPLSLITDKEKDDEIYVQQMHVVSFQLGKESKEYNDYTLFRGRENKDLYLLTHLLKKEGQTYNGGAVKNLFEAQWMVNHSQKQIKDHLDLASKIIFQSSDDSLTGSNVLTNIENGQVIKHEINQPLTMLNNKPDIAAMQSFKTDWQNIAGQINNISESMRGDTAPSGTAWRQVQALLQESHGLFELMTENKGLALIEMIRTYVLPFFRKQLNNTDEISTTLEDWQIKKIDAIYLPNEVNRRVNAKKKKAVLSGRIYDVSQEASDAQQVEQDLRSGLTGNQRFIKPSEIKNKTWKELFKDLELDNLDIDVTGEAKDVQGALTTLTTILQTLATNPMILQDPNVKLIFNKILNLVGGISPLELSQAQPTPQLAMANAGVGGGAQPMQLNINK